MSANQTVNISILIVKKKKKILVVMKANELFPGALVRVNQDGLCIKKDTIVEVRAVDADDKLIEKGLIGSAHCRPLDDNQFEGGIWCEYLDPLLLTPKILEKNGIELSVGPGGLYQGAISGINCHIEFNIIKYVHELQNALSLCGIEKEITI